VGLDPDRLTQEGRMARKINQLSALKVSAAKEPGRYADGGGLYLQVGPAGTKSWIFRFKANGRTRDMGLGPIATINLANAREMAANCRANRLRGIDPIEARKSERAETELAAARAMTFDQCRDTYIEAHEAGWRNEKHRQQWRNTLQAYVTPVFGKMPVQAIDVALVMKVLEPIWSTKPETASRVRGRIESVLDWARARGYRTGENPARWRGHLDDLLPRPSKVRRVQHHAALPYSKVGAFMAKLREQKGGAARALEFIILTAARSGEGRGAKWSEIDGAIWTVPPERMKREREHRVPLSRAALAILSKAKSVARGDLVFPGQESDKPISDTALAKVLGRVGYGDVTIHGFRSTFRDWVAETTNFPREVAEMALAHAVSDEVEAAYRRGDLFNKRVKLMDTWAAFCARAEGSATVVALKQRDV
jgi:integrase